MMIFYFVMCLLSVVYLVNRVNINFRRIFVSYKLIFLVSIVMDIFIAIMMACLVILSYKAI